MSPARFTPAADTGARPSPTEPLRLQVLAALALHRIATTEQLRQMLRPNGTRQLLSRALNTLRSTGWVNRSALPDAPTYAWYLTPEGARIIRDLPVLRGRQPYPLTSEAAAPLRTPHTLTVVRAHLAFAAGARQLGHEHGPWDWTPEVAHSIGEGERLIADAILHYTVADEARRRKLRAFVEADRTTMSSERLATKLIDYARLFHHEPQPIGRRNATTPSPAWLRWYPVFPRVLFILTGATRHRLKNRISDLQDMTQQHPLVATFAREVPLGAAVLEDIENSGPSAAVWIPLTGGEPRPWTEL